MSDISMLGGLEQWQGKPSVEDRLRMLTQVVARLVIALRVPLCNYHRRGLYDTDEHIRNMYMVGTLPSDLFEDTFFVSAPNGDEMPTETKDQAAILAGLLNMEMGETFEDVREWFDLLKED